MMKRICLEGIVFTIKMENFSHLLTLCVITKLFYAAITQENFIKIKLITVQQPWTSQNDEKYRCTTYQTDIILLSLCTRVKY